MLSFLKNLIFCLPVLGIYASIFLSDEIHINVKINLFTITFLFMTFFYFLNIFYDYIEPSKNNKIYLPYGDVSEDEDSNDEECDEDTKINEEKEGYECVQEDSNLVENNSESNNQNELVGNVLTKLSDNCECYTDENYFYVDKNCKLQCLLEHPEFKNLIRINSNEH